MQQLYTFGSSYYIFAEKVGFYKIGCILSDKKSFRWFFNQPRFENLGDE